MKLIIRQKVLTWGAKFDVENELHQRVFKVHSKVFTMLAELYVLTPETEERLIRIKRYFTLLPKYKLSNGNGHLLATIKMEFTLLKPKFTIKVPMSDTRYTVEGDFYGADFRLSKNGKVVGGISKHLGFTDRYSLDFVDDEDQAFLTAVVIVIDNALYNRDRDDRQGDFPRRRNHMNLRI